MSLSWSRFENEELIVDIWPLWFEVGSRGLQAARSKDERAVSGISGDRDEDAKVY